MDEIIQYISNLGFPIAISIYLLTRFDNRLNDLKASIDELAKTIAKLQAK